MLLTCPINIEFPQFSKNQCSFSPFWDYAPLSTWIFIGEKQFFTMYFVAEDL